MQGGGGGGQYIQELQLIVRASLPPELCCAVQYNICTSVLQGAFLYGPLCIRCGKVQWIVLLFLALRCIQRLGEYGPLPVQQLGEYGRLPGGGILTLVASGLLCAISLSVSPPSSLNFGSYSLVIRQAHCQILVTITSIVVCVILLPLTFYNQKSLFKIETCFMVVTFNNNNLFYVFLLFPT